jgi:diguanylate cyclase (GGDEF)-like protein
VALAGFAAGLAVGVLVALVLTRRARPHASAEPSDLRRAIARLGDALASTHDRHAIVEVVLDTARLIAGAEEARFWNIAGRRLSAVGTNQVLARGSGLAGAVADSGQAAIGASADSEPPARTAMAAPLHIQGRLAGVLAVYGRDRRFTGDELETLQTFARQAEAAIDNAFLHEETARLAITDGLTGVWNRRYFDLRTAEELETAVRFGEPFSLVLIDLDDFKQVNDVHGHQAGDAALVELARRLTSSTREVDLIARYGGEEFALVLPRTDPEGAARLAEKVRRTVAASPFETGGTGLDLTVSAGVATYPVNGGTVKELIEAADAALYRAKGAGKNRVEQATAQHAVEGSTT